MADAAPARQDSELEYCVDPSRTTMKNDENSTCRMGADSDVEGVVQVEGSCGEAVAS